jgi:DNA-binding transcriptional ArsR family regulator
MSLLPSRPDAEPSEDAGPRVIGVDSEDADEVLSALSSGTARALLAQLHDEPAPPSELADSVGTSLQNVQYHLEKLHGAGAVEVVDTAYSAKGREMDVYAPADQPLVIFAGDDSEGSTLRTALARLLGAVTILGAASVLVQGLFGRGTLLPEFGGAPAADDGAGAGGVEDGGAASPAGGDGGDVSLADAGTPTPDGGGVSIQMTPQEETDVATEAPVETAGDLGGQAVETATEAAREGAGALPPGLIFFAGGLFVLLVVAAVFAVRR